MSARLHLTSFVGGAHGPWHVTAMSAVCGAGLKAAAAITVCEGANTPTDSLWTLRGVASHLRYTSREEREELAQRQEGLGRLQACLGAMIPLRKSPAWWALAQDERRRIVVDSSQHFTVGTRYLPAVARKLYHSRDLGEDFDFVTWFEYAPQHAAAFDELLRALRSTEEWLYVDREIDIRLIRAS